MKFISNIIIATSLVIYVFFPLFDLGIFGNKTGYDFTETMINSECRLSYALFSLIPFVSGFAAIIFNCFKSRYWSIISFISVLASLFFYYSIYSNGIIDCLSFKINSLAWGFEVSVILNIVASLLILLSLISFKKLMSRNKEND
ncbi:MAG: hypothetical protein PHR45_04555 [Muribaculaceae bacterium]|nr:hypothetical protein [Muribaculaceae bacterium]